jgi:Flp pilus assembly protein TadB
MAPLTILAALNLVLTAGLGWRARGATRRAAARRRRAEVRAAPGQRATPTAVMAALRRRWRGRFGAAGEGHGLPGVLEDVARGVRAGSSLRQACADAATAAGPSAGAAGLATAVAEADRGTPLGTAFGRWAVTGATTDERLAAGALALAATAGGPQARALDGVAATLRERRAVVAEIRAQSAQARLSAVVIGALPLLFLLWAVATDRRTAAFLVVGPVGWACLGAGVGLEVAGALWMRRLLRGAAP